MRATYSASTSGMHHMFLRQGFKSFSAKRRRTVSREMLACSVRRTSSPAKIRASSAPARRVGVSLDFLQALMAGDRHYFVCGCAALTRYQTDLTDAETGPGELNESQSSCRYLTHSSSTV
jgi:hypothetical protein